MAKLQATNPLSGREVTREAPDRFTVAKFTMRGDDEFVTWHTSASLARRHSACPDNPYLPYVLAPTSITR